MPSRTTRRSITVDMDLSGAFAVLRSLPREASAELRDASEAIVVSEARRIRAAGSSKGRQASAAASSTKAARDRVPAIAVGGARRVTRSKARAGDLFFGSDAGSVRFMQFPRPQFDGSYWFWDTLGRDAKRIMGRWGAALDNVVDRWAGRDA